MVKTVKAKTFLDFGCDYYIHNFLTRKGRLSLVEEVEQKLQIESSEQINDTLTKEELQTAAEMFLYLISCPKLLKSWFMFYEDLFLTQSADQIILSLNRMMKTEASQDKKAKVLAEKLLNRTSSLLSLKYEKIHRLLPKENSGNGSATFNDSFIQYGT